MLKRIILGLAATAFMLPLAAQSASGKWSVELGAWYVQPRNVRINFADEVNTLTLAHVKDYYNGPERRWSPEITLSYETPTWKTWLHYYHYDKTASGFASSTPNQTALLATYMDTSLFFFGPARAQSSPGGSIDAIGPSTYAGNLSAATTRLNETDWSWNIGRKFHPSKNWEMLVYTGLSRYEATLDNNIDTIDQLGISYAPVNSTVVAMQSYSMGWGLDFGLINSFKASQHLSFNAGAGIDMLSLKEDTYYIQTFIDNTGAATIADNEFNSQTTISPAFKIFLESQVNFTENWFAKIGYRYEMVRDVFNRSLTPTNTLNSLYFGLTAPKLSRHLGKEGFYASVGFSW